MLWTPEQRYFQGSIIMSTHARIATLCQGGVIGPSVEKNREQVLASLDLALGHGPDLVCLPETFTKPRRAIQSAADYAEPISGPTIEAVAKRARQYQCYIICPLMIEREGKLWNTALLIDRAGDIIGRYDKVQPVTSASDYTVFEQGAIPGCDRPVFDLDFGRIGVQICFDVGFPESWQALADQGARLVFWPSAYNGGFPLQAYAYLHHFYVISAVRTDKSRIIDPCGEILAETDQNMKVIVREINLDYLVCHYDFNLSIPDKILAAYPGRVTIRSHRDDAHFLVEPLDDTLTTAQLQMEFGFEATFDYHQRHRTAYPALRQGQSPAAQAAAHGDRPPYETW